MKYKHIIWDWNGTLIDDNWLCVEVLNALLKKYHKPPTTFETYRRQFGFPIADYYEGLGFDFSVESYDEVADEYIAHYTGRQRECRLHAGIPQVLVACADRGFAQSVLSAYHQDLLRAVITDFGIAGHFAHLSGRQDHYAGSKIDAGQTLLRRLSCDPREAVLIGDTTHDHEVSRALGCDCLLLGYGHQHPDRLHDCGVPVLDSARAVMDFL